MDCPICKSRRTTTRVLKEYRWDELGVDSVTLLNVTEIICHSCGEETVSIPNQKAVFRQAIELLSLVNRSLSGREFALLREFLDLSGQECASLFAVTNVTVSRWENGQDIPGPADRLMRTFVLSALGYRNSQLVSKLGAIRQNDLNEVRVDLSKFSGHSFSYQTCQTFGNMRSGAWVVTNTRKTESGIKHVG